MTTQKRRRLKRGKITHVSLCRRAMNQLPVMMKSGDRVQIELLTKVQPEGLLHALVYVPEENGAVDFEGDVAPASVIKQMAHDFLANGGNIDIEHDLKVLGPDRVRIAETFIVQKGDPRFAGWKDYQGRDVNAEGSWALMLKVLDPELRAAAERGELNGVSMFGSAEVELLQKTTNTPTNTPMTPEQMQALVELMTKSISAALKPAAPVAPVQTTDIPFEGNPLDSEDVAKHMDRLMLAKVNWNDPASIAKYQGHVAKRQAQIAAASETDEQKLAKAQAELKKAQEALAKIQKTSNVTTDPAPTEGSGPVAVGLSKSEKDQMAAGKAAMRKFQGVGDKK